MLQIFFISLAIVGALATDVPCRKLHFFGNTVQNKALLSPMIILGQRGLKIPLVEEMYKTAIDIKTVLKGTLGNWKKKILIAGKFSSKNNSQDLCQFTSDSEENRIYFLDVISPQNGEFAIVFNPELASQQNLDIINSTICQNCAESPKLTVNQQSIGGSRIQLDCISMSKPTPSIKWINSNEKSRTKTADIGNGARLIITPIDDINSEMFTCTGVNVLGESTYGVVIRDVVTRCEANDKLQCNGHGKCYKDKIDYGKMFCRCDPGFVGSQCSNNTNTLNQLVRSSSLDSIYCANNGDAYHNEINNKTYCLCKTGFYGQRCSIEAANLSKKEATIQRSSSNNINEKDKEEIRKMLDNATSKVALKYIIIGSAIVLVGCVLVLIVVLILWCCHFKRKLKRHCNSGAKTNEDNKQLGTSIRRNGHSPSTLHKFDDGITLLPGNTERSNVPTQPKPLLYREHE